VHLQVALKHAAACWYWTGSGAATAHSALCQQCSGHMIRQDCKLPVYTLSESALLLALVSDSVLTWCRKVMRPASSCDSGCMPARFACLLPCQYEPGCRQQCAAVCGQKIAGTRGGSVDLWSPAFGTSQDSSCTVGQAAVGILARACTVAGCGCASVVLPRAYAAAGWVTVSSRC
jgi:hypothetical protein